MEVIEGFWLGASRFGGDVDLDAVAERVGGYAALLSGGRDALVAGGVLPGVAELWAAARPARSSGHVVTLASPEYPASLRTMPHPPPYLCVEGDAAVLHEPSVAVVGTRACTAYGTGVARHLAGALAAAGQVVVSGLARGIDAHAHRSTLGVGRTVAVLGHGLAHTAPRSNRQLRRSIVEQGGAMVSTWPDEAEPRPGRFPVRNRWIVGLSRAVVVVEAPLRSGAMITAREALTVGREVHVVPGPLGAPASRGCLQLLHENAQAIVDVDRFVTDLTGWQAPRREAWLDRLFAGATVDEAARVARLPTTDLLAELTRLEVAGCVVRLPGHRYAPSHGAP